MRSETNWEKYSEDFLWFSYFGVIKDDVKGDIEKAIKACADRAYLDLSRTIGYTISASTIEKNKSSKKQYEEYSKVKTTFKDKIVQLLCCKIQKMLNVESEGKFDEFHEKLCNLIVDEGKADYKASVNGEGTPLFKEDKKITYGQAQKWVNMTLKNLLIMNKIDNEEIIKYMHIPLDSYIFKAAGTGKDEKIFKDMNVHGLGVPNHLGEWSRIIDYNKYKEYQNKVRENTQYNQILWEGDAWIAQAKKEKEPKEQKEE